MHVHVALFRRPIGRDAGRKAERLSPLGEAANHFVAVDAFQFDGGSVDGLIIQYKRGGGPQINTFVC